MPKTSKILPESVRQTAIAGAPLLIVIVLFILVGNFGISKVLGVRAQIQLANTSLKTLTQKLNLLQTLSSIVSSGAPLAATAVPDANPTLSVISQLKILALQQGVVISGIKSSGGTSAANGMNTASISFTADGAMIQVFSFLAATSKVAPLMVVDKIAMTEALGSTRADISVKTYWANLPKTIPSVDAPVTDLTTSEKETLTKGGANPNPFGQ